MSPKEDRLFRTSLIALLILYIVGGNLAQLTGSVGYPRFDFNFINTTSSATEAHYQLKFIALNDESLSAPIYFAEANAWIDKTQSRAARRLINQLGIAAYSGDAVEIAQLQHELESLYFDELVSAEYALVLRGVNPIGHYTPETIITYQTLQHFTFSRVLTGAP